MNRDTYLKKGISGTALKIIAIVTMLIDHVGAAVIDPMLLYGFGNLYNTYTVLRLIGRIAFPIFCFLLVEGFAHTRSIKKYAFRLFIFALISEVPFNLGMGRSILLPDYQNVFFTLFIGLITIWAIHYINIKCDSKYRIIVTVIAISSGMLAATILRTDYTFIGVLLIVILYIFEENRLKQCFIGAISFIWEPTSVFAFLLLYYYNGTRGKSINKYIFYWFYPAHLTVLYIIILLISV